MSSKITKAIIPVAGFGTRFLPITKAQPKEMLPIVDKPIIQYVVEDAVSAGIEDIILVTGWQKRSIEDHFDRSAELERKLEESGKLTELEEVKSIANLANFTYIRQKGPYGTATPIWNARHLIGNEPFLVLWGDDFLDATPSRAQQLVSAYQEHGGSFILGCIRTNKDSDYQRYGYAVGKEVAAGRLAVEHVVEKPGPGIINSDYASVAGYLFGPEIFNAIEESKQVWENGGSVGEHNHLYAVKRLLEQGKSGFAIEITNSKYHDCGNKLEYLKTVVEYGLKHEELKTEFTAFLQSVAKRP